MARDPRLHRNLLYLRLARPRGALGFGVRSDAVPDSDDLTPAAARARWHRVRPKPRRTAVAHSPPCLAHELGNRTQPHTKRRTPASFDSIVRSGTLTHGGSWTLLGHPWFGFGSPDLGTTELRQRGAVRHIWVPRPPPRLGVGPGLRGRSPFRAKAPALHPRLSWMPVAFRWRGILGRPCRRRGHDDSSSHATDEMRQQPTAPHTYSCARAGRGSRFGSGESRDFTRRRFVFLSRTWSWFAAPTTG